MPGMKRLWFTLLLVLSGSLASAQAPDSLQQPADSSLTDSLGQAEGPVKENWFQRDYPAPKKAALLSLIVPGGGQMYNKRWWKVPLVYGAVIGMGFTIDYNQDLYRRLRDALENKRNNLPHEFEGTNIDNERSLRSLRDRYDKNTQLAYVGMFLVYTLQAMEAFVDAHLKSFDISEDLSLRVEPRFELHGLAGPTFGIGVSIPIGQRTSPTLPSVPTP